MEASVRLLNSAHRHRPHSLLRKTLCPPSLVPSPFPNPPRYHHRLIALHLHNPNWNPPYRTPFHFIHFPPDRSPISNNQFAHIFSAPERSPYTWHYSFDTESSQQNGVAKDKSPVITAVLLGWLGSRRKHLRRYVELYNSKGIHAVTFVASVRDVLSFDLGRKLEESIGILANELSSWISESEKDGRERVLMFHTFSNTGWLAYGAILDNFRGRDDLLKKIKGCVVDSGGDPNIDPKVWAAGFTAALLKKRSSSANALVGAAEGDELKSSVTMSKVQKTEPLLIETLLLSAFEKLFSYLLNLPNIRQRLMKVIYALKNQPPCPQLYLYSTEDKVIPYKSVESFIEDQRRGGRKVWSHNFVSSPHVDHYRTFPGVYASELETFLKECVF